jgi:hypothetical protein
MNSTKPTTNTPVELVERTGPEIFKFENPGDCLRGRLITIETTDIGGKPTLRYIVHDEEEDRLFSFLGTVDLNTKLRPSDISKIVDIRYVGQDSEAGQGKNPIKRFKVFGEKGK